MDERGGCSRRPAPHRPGPGPGFTEEVERLGLPELRARREEAEAEEAHVSYLRRLLQGRLDILRAELVRRSAGGTQDVAGLPSILTDDAPGTFSAVPRVVDVLCGELARRYRDGTAQVSQLLE